MIAFATILFMLGLFGVIVDVIAEAQSGSTYLMSRVGVFSLKMIGVAVLIVVVHALG